MILGKGGGITKAKHTGIPIHGFLCVFAAISDMVDAGGGEWMGHGVTSNTPRAN
jgi:hypothetical protein